MQILLLLTSIKMHSEERGLLVFVAAPPKSAETKFQHPDPLKALDNFGSYKSLPDSEVFIEYPVI